MIRAWAAINEDGEIVFRFLPRDSKKECLKWIYVEGGETLLRVDFEKSPETPGKENKK